MTNMWLVMTTKRASPLYRFRLKVQVLGPDDCWLWTGSKSGGYGNFAFNGKTVKAHRYSYIITYGSIPDGMEICHTCDTPACVNPRHLWAGTHGDNVRDCISKGRGNKSYGKAHSKAIMTEQDVREIRASGRSLAALGRLYETTPENISAIQKRRTWKHI